MGRWVVASAVIQHDIYERTWQSWPHEAEETGDHSRHMSDRHRGRPIQPTNELVKAHFIGALQVERAGSYRADRRFDRSHDVAKIDGSDTLFPSAQHCHGLLACGE